MLDCRDVVTDLGRFLDGELPPQDSSLVEAHIRDCPGCRRELLALQSLSASLETLTAPPVPAGISDEIMLRIRGQHHESRKNWGILEFWKPWPVAMRLSAAGVAAAAFAIGLMLGSATSRPPSQTQSDMAWVGLSAGSMIASAHLEAVR